MAAGAGLGCLFGFIWFALMRAAGRAQWFAAVARWPLFSNVLMVKDTWGCPEPLLLEQSLEYKGAREKMALHNRLGKRD